jgi:hypothetical protein
MPYELKSSKVSLQLEQYLQYVTYPFDIQKVHTLIKKFKWYFEYMF